MAEYPTRLIAVMATPKIIEGKASGINTLLIICQVLAPMDKAASISPQSSSFKEDSTKRATKGIAASVNGTIEATVPIEVPTIKRVKGIASISSIIKGMERAALTIEPKIEFTLISRYDQVQ